MLRFLLLAILLLVVARLFWRLVDSILEAARVPGRTSSGAPAVKLVRDPVCGTYVSPSAALSLPAAGGTQYFCSEACRKKFKA